MSHPLAYPHLTLSQWLLVDADCADAAFLRVAVAEPRQRRHSRQWSQSDAGSRPGGWAERHHGQKYRPDHRPRREARTSHQQNRGPASEEAKDLMIGSCFHWYILTRPYTRHKSHLLGRKAKALANCGPTDLWTHACSRPETEIISVFFWPG